MLVKIFIVGLVLAIVAAVWMASKQQTEDVKASSEPSPEPEVKEETPLGYETDAVEKPKKTRKPKTKKDKIS